MSSLITRWRYLTNFDSLRLPNLFSDVLVIGAGIAGLRAALAAAESADVLVITKGRVKDSATSWAQGGIAAAMSPEDSVEKHARDTLNVACGIAHPEVVRGVVAEAPSHVREMIEWGACFDSRDGALAAGREGAHSMNRILHADGDATGREMIRTLLARARSNPRIRIFEHCFAIDLLTVEEQVVGAVTFHPEYRHQLFWATTTILASGGVGRVYRETTNPAISTGDGLALAMRAGAKLRDLEMVQFHPTTLYVAGAARALISEAVRGEGAYLRNRSGERFMQRYDSRGELASRDVVSRAISSELGRDRSPYVFLDVRHFPRGAFAARFPNIDRLCKDFDVDPERDMIPVRPSAHYHIGGVVSDDRGQTNLAGLLVCGEAASTGLHGANRLASNSLLEGLVFGKRAGLLAAVRANHRPEIAFPPAVRNERAQSPRSELDLTDVRHSLQSVMTRQVGIERAAERMQEAAEMIEFWSRYVLDKVFDEPAGWETQNLLTIAWCLTMSAAARCESRGVHYRSDYPADDDRWRLHVEILRRDGGLDLSTSRIDDAE